MQQTKLVNFKKALGSLERSLATPATEERDLAGIVKSFEICYELAWTTLRTVLAEKGQLAQGPRDVFRQAWQLGILVAGNEEVWLGMIEDHNLTVHTYDEEFARAMVERIRSSDFPAFQSLRELFETV